MALSFVLCLVKTIDHCATSGVNFLGLERLVDSLVKSVDDEITVERAMITKKLGKIGTRVQKKRLRGVMNKVQFDADFTTRPFGFRSVLSMKPPRPVADPLTHRVLPLYTIMPGSLEWLKFCDKYRLMELRI